MILNKKSNDSKTIEILKKACITNKTDSGTGVGQFGCRNSNSSKRSPKI